VNAPTVAPVGAASCRFAFSRNGCWSLGRCWACASALVDLVSRCGCLATDPALQPFNKFSPRPSSILLHLCASRNPSLPLRPHRPRLHLLPSLSHSSITPPIWWLSGEFPPGPSPVEKHPTDGGPPVAVTMASVASITAATPPGSSGEMGFRGAVALFFILAFVTLA